MFNLLNSYNTLNKFSFLLFTLGIKFEINIDPSSETDMSLFKSAVTYILVIAP